MHFISHVCCILYRIHVAFFKRIHDALYIAYIMHFISHTYCIFYRIHVAFYIVYMLHFISHTCCILYRIHNAFYIAHILHFISYTCCILVYLGVIQGAIHTRSTAWTVSHWKKDNKYFLLFQYGVQVLIIALWLSKRGKRMSLKDKSCMSPFLLLKSISSRKAREHMLCKDGYAEYALNSLQ
jgi:hypothetical protein